MPLNQQFLKLELGSALCEPTHTFTMFLFDLVGIHSGSLQETGYEGRQTSVSPSADVLILHFNLKLPVSFCILNA